MSDSGVTLLDALPEAECRAALERCCGSSRWVTAMTTSRPFGSREALFAAFERAFGSLQRGDWLEAFTHHPKIGDVDSLREKFASTARWAGEEQKGAAVADEHTLTALAEGNRDYLKQFGYIFIVSATGRSAAEMLDLLDARLGNPPEIELANAASEQKKITRLRLEKLLDAS